MAPSAGDKLVFGPKKSPRRYKERYLKWCHLPRNEKIKTLVIILFLIFLQRDSGRRGPSSHQCFQDDANDIREKVHLVSLRWQASFQSFFCSFSFLNVDEMVHWSHNSSHYHSRIWPPALVTVVKLFTRSTDRIIPPILSHSASNFAGRVNFSMTYFRGFSPWVAKPGVGELWLSLCCSNFDSREIRARVSFDVWGKN